MLIIYKPKRVAFALYSSTYVLVAVGFLASVLIENQQKLSHVSTQDPLTRLLNRHGLEQSLQTSLAHVRRGSSLPTSAIAVHIDHFKEVNNNFGSRGRRPGAAADRSGSAAHKPGQRYAGPRWGRGIPADSVLHRSGQRAKAGRAHPLRRIAETRAQSSTSSRSR